jgi:Ca2+-binding EF-hand superfamily protein
MFTSLCREETLRHALMTWGEKFSPEEADKILAEAPVDRKGNIDIRKFAHILTRGEDEEETGA